MSKEMIVSQIQPKSNLPSREEMEMLQTVAKFAADSKHFEKLGGLGGVFCVAMYAHELGIPPMTALYGGMQNIMGKITISPELLMGIIRQAGHKIDILETTDKICKIKGTRRDTGETYTSVYEFSEAEKAGLVKPGGGWTKNPSDMLFARASGRLKRRLFPDIATKAYVEGELEEAEMVEVTNSSSSTGVLSPDSISKTPAAQLVSLEDAERLDKEIAAFIDPVDKEYRKQILNFLGITSLDKMPSIKLKSIQSSIDKKIKSLKEKEVQTAVVETSSVTISPVTPQGTFA